MIIPLDREGRMKLFEEIFGPAGFDLTRKQGDDDNFYANPDTIFAWVGFNSGYLQHRKMEKELSDIAAAIGTVEFMDPPDGGDTPLSEQVRRLKASRDFYKARTRNALGTTYEPTGQRVTVYAADNSIDLLINLPNLVETLRDIDKQVREGKSKRMDFIDSHLRTQNFDDLIGDLS